MDSKIQAKNDGIDTGKQRRFRSASLPAPSSVRKKEKYEREYQNPLEMLLAENPQYAAFYTKVTEKIEQTQQAVDLALIDINQRLEASDKKLQIMRENASELADGTGEDP